MDVYRLFSRALDRGRTVEVAKILAQHPGLARYVDSYGFTPVMRAARLGHTAIVQSLLDGGADANACDRWGQSALCLAAEGGNLDVVSLLLSRGADVKFKYSRTGWTALFEACAAGHVEVAQRLLQVKACRQRVNEVDLRGRTALWHACSKSHVEVVRLLLPAGARPDIPDCQNSTARQVVCWTGLQAIEWYEGNLEKWYSLHRARRAFEDYAAWQHCPWKRPPAYLRDRVRAGRDPPLLEVKQDEILEWWHDDEAGQTVRFLVESLNEHLFTELMQGLRLQ